MSKLQELQELVKERHQYTIVGAGVAWDGWYKYELLRNDGKRVKAGKGRVKQLRQNGQLVDQLPEIAKDGGGGSASPSGFTVAQSTFVPTYSGPPEKKRKKDLLKEWVEKERGVPKTSGPAPGPPPAPGLVWHDQTHRWLRPEDLQVAQPPAVQEQPVKPKLPGIKIRSWNQYGISKIIDETQRYMEQMSDQDKARVQPYLDRWKEHPDYSDKEAIGKILSEVFGIDEGKVSTLKSSEEQEKTKVWFEEHAEIDDADSKSAVFVSQGLVKYVPYEHLKYINRIRVSTSRLADYNKRSGENHYVSAFYTFMDKTITTGGSINFQIIHEAGHGVFRFGLSKDQVNWTEHCYRHALMSGKGCPSAYAKTNPSEYFCECYRAYALHPDEFMKKNEPMGKMLESLWKTKST